MYLEQCWSQGEIAGVTLTSDDISEPFPKIVRQCLSNKIKNAKSLKNETFEHIGEARRLFVGKHKECPLKSGSSCNSVLGITKDLVEHKDSERETQVLDEIQVLIQGSRWQELVDPSRFCNLAE